MRKLLLLVFFQLSFGQQQQITLEQINRYHKKDTVKVEMMIDFCVANVFSNQKDNLEVAQKALALSKAIQYQLGEIRALNCIGNYYYQQAIYDKSIAYYTSALKIAEKNNDNRNTIIGKSNLASVYVRTNSTDKALKLFREMDADLIRQGQAFSQNRAAILTNMGMAYSSVNQHKQALICHKKALEICEQKKIIFGMALAQSNIGEELIRDNQPQAALKYLISSRKISEQNDFKNFLGQIYKNLGEVHWIKKNQDSAVFYMKKAQSISTKINDQNTLIHTAGILHDYYARLNDYPNAYKAALDFIAVNDSINNKEKSKTITEVNTRYETEKKEAQIKALSQQKKISKLENQKQKTVLLFVLIGLCSVIVIGFLLFKRFKTAKENELLKITLQETEKTLSAEKKATESELKALKSQMNPHFIFNALNSIQEQFMYGDKRIANEQMGNFTYLTRQILNVSGKKQILLATEIDILTKYLELEKMRFNAEFEYSIALLGNTDEDYHEMPPMLIQPFVENSIKHGLLHKNGVKKIAVSFQLDPSETFLSCLVTDNGIGRQKSAEIKAKNHTTHESFSTQAIEQRLELLNEKLQLPSLILYTDLFDEQNQPSGTQVLINIPIV